MERDREIKRRERDRKRERREMGRYQRFSILDECWSGSDRQGPCVCVYLYVVILVRHGSILSADLFSELCVEECVPVLGLLIHTVMEALQ
jgi:hypothetical protein